jgi:gliding motility-associated-like protein
MLLKLNQGDFNAFFSIFPKNLLFMFKFSVQKPIFCRLEKPIGVSFQLLLVALILSIFLPFHALAQPGYTISQPTWANPPALTGGTNVTFTSQNDAVATAITIPFYFRFYGNSYNQLYINTNGWVAFTAQTLATANTNANPVTLPSGANTTPKNCIMGPWQDWNNTGGVGIVRYRTDGVSPNRQFVVTYNAWPLNGCSTTNGTFQIVLNECTNVIEIYIYQKPACTTTNSNRAVLGMQNLAGTVAHVVAGRNNTGWSVLNTAPELHRFTPDNPVINGTATVCIGATTQLTASITGGTWSSASPTIATVSPLGLVTAVSAGQTVITYNLAQAGTNACQRTFKDIIVQPSPSISAQPPSSVPVLAGQSTSISLTSPAATGYQWFLNAGAGWSPIIAGSVYTNINTATLGISNVSPGMSGYLFRCRVSTPCGSDTSSICTLQVTGLNGPGLFIDTAFSCQGGPADTLVVVPIRVQNFTGIGAVSLVIDYDSSSLLYLGYQNSLLSSANLIINSPVPGKIYLAWYSLVASNIGNGNLIEFRFLASASSIFNFDDGIGGNCEIADSTGNTLTSVFVDGFVLATPRDTVLSSVAACNSYTWAINGQTYTQSGNYQAQRGCRNNRLSLQINLASSSTLAVSACDSFVWALNGQRYTSSGVYSFTLPNSVGCDSTIFLNLQITNRPVIGQLSGSQSICVGSTTLYSAATAGGVWSSSDTTVVRVNPITGLVSGVGAGIATLTYTLNGNGVCPPVIATRTITVNARPLAGVLSGNQSLCVGAQTGFSSSVAGGRWYSSNPSIASIGQSNGLLIALSAGSIVVKYVVQDAFGCLSDTLTRSVVVLPVSNTFINASVCSPATYSFNGQILSNAGSYTYITPNYLGCDSTVTLILTVNQPSQSTQTRIVCDSLLWNGQIYRSSGVYNYQTTNSVGCDSLATLNLTVGYTGDTSFALFACDSLVWNGQVLRQSGQYSAIFQSSTGCDSTVRLTLSMSQTDSLFEQTFVCDSVYWPVSGTWIKQSGTYIVRRSFATRCDSVYRLNLLVDRTPASVGGFDSVICWLPGYELWYLDRNRPDLVWYEPGNPLNVLGRGSLLVLNDNFDVLDLEVSASSPGGCLSPPTRIRVRNEVYDAFPPIPNAFSPNKNGVNDVWFVESEFTMELRIFDRWGRLVHQDSGLRVSWDGKNYDPGVYPYEIRQNNCVGQKVSTKGVINLIR